MSGQSNNVMLLAKMEDGSMVIMWYEPQWDALGEG